MVTLDRRPVHHALKPGLIGRTGQAIQQPQQLRHLLPTGGESTSSATISFACRAPAAATEHCFRSRFARTLDCGPESIARLMVALSEPDPHLQDVDPVIALREPICPDSEVRAARPGPYPASQR